MNPSRELLLEKFPMLKAFPVIDLFAVFAVAEQEVPVALSKRDAKFWCAGFRYAALGKTLSMKATYEKIRSEHPEAFDDGKAACDRILFPEVDDENQN
jgi:hypothetical protein